MESAINATLVVSSVVECERSEDTWPAAGGPDSIWRQAMLGCRVMHILQDMFHFNMTYEYSDVLLNSSAALSDRVHVHARPIALTADLLDSIYPVLPIFTWRFGFILRRPDASMFRAYYSQPFTRPLWNCLYAMTVLVTGIFSFLTWWENRLINGRGECCPSYELLLAIGAYCQHVLPGPVVLQSRRTAYFTFFLFSYVIYTYYSSNLLSHMVNDVEPALSLTQLAESDFQVLSLEDVKSIFNIKNFPVGNRTLIMNKISTIRTVNISQGLEAVKTGKTALLSDYVTVYAALRGTFDNNELCKLTELDVFSKIRKYFFTSKDFPYKEQFKIGLLRAREAGVLQRLTTVYYSSAYAPHCAVRPLLTHAHIFHIVLPLTTLTSTYVLGVLVMLAEKWYFNRTRPFPYVD